MGWVRLDDGFTEDPVIANLSDPALALWVAGIAYANRKLTDGFVPNGVGYGQLRYCDGNAVPYVRELEGVGRWVPVEGGWQIHRYLDWQRSRETILGERETVKERVDRFRRGATTPETNGRSNGVAIASKEPQPQPQQFENFYARYPRHVGRRAAEKAFVSALRRADGSQILAGAERFAADPNLPDAQFVPYPATWLNRDGWADDPLPARTGPRGPGSGPDRTALALRRLKEKRS